MVRGNEGRINGIRVNLLEKGSFENLKTLSVTVWPRDVVTAGQTDKRTSNVTSFLRNRLKREYIKRKVVPRGCKVEILGDEKIEGLLLSL